MRMSCLDERDWFWKPGIRIYWYNLVRFLRIELKLEVDQFMQAHSYPHLVVFDDLEEVLELYVVSG